MTTTPLLDTLESLESAAAQAIADSRPLGLPRCSCNVDRLLDFYPDAEAALDRWAKGGK